MAVDLNILAETLPSLRNQMGGGGARHSAGDERMPCQICKGPTLRGGICSACRGAQKPVTARKAKSARPKPAAKPEPDRTDAPRFLCRRCGREWQARSTEDQLDESYIPARCPGCRSRDWDRPRAERKTGSAKSSEPPRPVEVKPVPRVAGATRPVLTEPSATSTSGFTSVLAGCGFLHTGTPQPKRVR